MSFIRRDYSYQRSAWLPLSSGWLASQTVDDHFRLLIEYSLQILNWAANRDPRVVIHCLEERKNIASEDCRQFVNSEAVAKFTLEWQQVKMRWNLFAFLLVAGFIGLSHSASLKGESCHWDKLAVHFAKACFLWFILYSGSMPAQRWQVQWGECLQKHLDRLVRLHRAEESLLLQQRYRLLRSLTQKSNV